MKTVPQDLSSLRFPRTETILVEKLTVTRGNKITCGCKQPWDDEDKVNKFLKQILDLQTECDEGKDKIKALQADVHSRACYASAKD
jgi:hypothetical protein